MGKSCALNVCVIPIFYRLSLEKEIDVKANSLKIDRDR